MTKFVSSIIPSQVLIIFISMAQWAAPTDGRLKKLIQSFDNSTSPEEAHRLYQAIEKARLGCWQGNDNGPRFLHQALHSHAKSGRKNMVQYLVSDLKMDINKGSKYGIVPLTAAISAGHEEIAYFLIEAGADVHAKDADKLNSAVCAAHKGMVGLAKHLILEKHVSLERDPILSAGHSIFCETSAERSNNAEMI